MSSIWKNCYRCSLSVLGDGLYCWECYHYVSCSEVSHEATTDSSTCRDNMKLAPLPDSYDLDRGLLLAVQAIQVTSKKIKMCVGEIILQV